MATRYASFARCSDLPERDVIAALVSRDECAALLGRLAAMPTARSAARALLALLGRLATPACTWLEGELVVELFEDEGATKVRVMSDIGGGLRERVVPVVVLRQSVAELVAAFDRRRELHALLRVERVSMRCALLVASDEQAAPISRPLDISETSLAFGAGLTPPEDVDSGWDDASSSNA